MCEVILPVWNGQNDKNLTCFPRHRLVNSLVSVEFDSVFIPKNKCLKQYYKYIH